MCMSTIIVKKMNKSIIDSLFSILNKICNTFTWTRKQLFKSFSTWRLCWCKPFCFGDLICDFLYQLKGRLFDVSCILFLHMDTSFFFLFSVKFFSLVIILCSERQMTFIMSRYILNDIGRGSENFWNFIGKYVTSNITWQVTTKQNPVLIA